LEDGRPWVDLHLCKFNSCDKLRLCSKYDFWGGLKGALKQFLASLLLAIFYGLLINFATEVH